MIIDRSVTNQQESSVPVAMFASRQNCIMSRLRGYHEKPAYMHWVYLSSPLCFMDESKRAMEQEIVTCLVLWVPRELSVALKGRDKHTQAAERLSLGEKILNGEQ